MNKTLLITFFILVICNLAFSQNKFPELETVKKIKIFESTRDDVKKILAEYIDEDYNEEDHDLWLLTDNAEIKVIFSKGDCDEPKTKTVVVK